MLHLTQLINKNSVLDLQLLHRRHSLQYHLLPIWINFFRSKDRLFEPTHVECTKLFLQPQQLERFSARFALFFSSVPRQIEHDACLRRRSVLIFFFEEEEGRKNNFNYTHKSFFNSISSLPMSHLKWVMVMLKHHLHRHHQNRQLYLVDYLTSVSLKVFLMLASFL